MAMTLRDLWLLGALVGVLAGGAGPGCAGTALGQPCTLDSECETGTLCGIDGTCQTFETVQAHLADLATAVDTPAPQDTGPAPELDTTGGSCDPPAAGVFEAGNAPCPEPNLKRTVSYFEIAAEGGAAGLANLGNPVVKNGFEEGDISLELWVDGSLTPGCARTIAWISQPEDRGADCTAVHTDTVPFAIPGLVTAVITSAVYDDATATVKGLISKSEILASLDPALAEVAGNLIQEDVDTDGDGTPDHTSITLKMVFE